jgi:hypothetical protein
MVPDCGLESANVKLAARERVVKRIRDFLIRAPGDARHFSAGLSVAQKVCGEGIAFSTLTS